MENARNLHKLLKRQRHFQALMQNAKVPGL